MGGLQTPATHLHRVLDCNSQLSIDSLLAHSLPLSLLSYKSVTQSSLVLLFHWCLCPSYCFMPRIPLLGHKKHCLGNLNNNIFYSLLLLCLLPTGIHSNVSFVKRVTIGICCLQTLTFSISQLYIS